MNEAANIGLVSSIQNKINGTPTFSVNDVKGNMVEDIINLADNPEQVRQVFFNEKKPVILSVESLISYPSQKLIFRVIIRLGLSVEEPVVIDMARKFMTNPSKWLKDNLMDYPQISEGFLRYASAVFEELLPLLDERAEGIIESDTLTETIRTIYSHVEKNHISSDYEKREKFKIEFLPDGQGNYDKCYCIKGSKAFKAMLKDMGSEFKIKDVLRACDYWKGGSLLKKNAGRLDYKLEKSDSTRWYVIKDNYRIRKGGVSHVM